MSHDHDCRALANRGQCQVIAVDYRLAPEHPFPAAADDAAAALECIVANAGELGVDSHLAVGGDSAGGNLAAVVALHAHDVGIHLRFQLLIYPAVDDDDGDYPSRRRTPAATCSTRSRWSGSPAEYFPGGAPSDWQALPMLAEPRGRGPGAGDHRRVRPLRDEGEAYAGKLQAAGVPAKASRYDGLIHGFFGMGAAHPCRQRRRRRGRPGPPARRSTTEPSLGRRPARARAATNVGGGELPSARAADALRQLVEAALLVGGQARPCRRRRSCRAARRARPGRRRAADAGAGGWGSGAPRAGRCVTTPPTARRRRSPPPRGGFVRRAPARAGRDPCARARDLGDPRQALGAGPCCGP